MFNAFNVAIKGTQSTPCRGFYDKNKVRCRFAWNFSAGSICFSDSEEQSCCNGTSSKSQSSFALTVLRSSSYSFSSFNSPITSHSHFSAGRSLSLSILATATSNHGIQFQGIVSIPCSYNQAMLIVNLQLHLEGYPIHHHHHRSYRWHCRAVSGTRRRNSRNRSVSAVHQCSLSTNLMAILCLSQQHSRLCQSRTHRL